MMRDGSSVDDTQAERPWYRHVWPWLLMLPPFASVCGGISMIWLATHTPASLAVADYAHIEEITAARFAADAQAARDGLAAEARIDRSAGEDTRITIVLREPNDVSAESLQLRLRHMTSSALDRNTTARRVGTEYRALTELAPGSFLLEIEPLDATWRLAGRLRPTDQRIELVSPDTGLIAGDSMAPQ
jgi:hypothetical protein